MSRWNLVVVATRLFNAYIPGALLLVLNNLSSVSEAAPFLYGAAVCPDQAARFKASRAATEGSIGVVVMEMVSSMQKSASPS